MMERLRREEGQSLDLVEENIKTLKRLFPDIVREGKTGGKIDFDRLREILGEEIDTEEEPYSFTWHGKRAALRLAQTPSMGTLRPCKEESVDWENTQNLMIERDNLEVLKLLQKSYYAQIKMIYIDPPYNTGNDFVYRDDYKDPLAHYLEETGQIDEAGRKTSTNTNTSGRYHTNWLNMIYPRLRLARNLLRNDGVIFISIDDNEQANLKKLCDEVFGSENFISCVPRRAKVGGNQGTFFVPSKDYVLAYAKNITSLPPFGVPKDIQESDYKYTEEDGRKYKQGHSLIFSPSSDTLRPNQRYYIEAPDGSLIIPPGNVFPPEKKDGAKVKQETSADKRWVWSVDRYLQNKDKLMFGKGSDKNPLLDENGNRSQWVVYKKAYYDEDINATLLPEDMLYKFENFRATKELKELDIPFDYAKFSGMVCYFLSIMQNIKPLDLILDFFAGSGTTGE
ncbi:MAG: site-specific DNA-methyltransferase, partial [Acetobacter sp.]|nr:site-specific DNA-methyltransferase [Acetobacter sp.]